MIFLASIPRYLWWHYTTALVDFARIASNFFWFLWHYFSIELLVRTFFVPWRRLSETQGGFLARGVVGVVTRVVGVGARVAVFICAVVSYVGAAVLLVAIGVLWLFAPFLVILFLIIGIRTLVV